MSVVIVRENNLEYAVNLRHIKHISYSGNTYDDGTGQEHFNGHITFYTGKHDVSRVQHYKKVEGESIEDLKARYEKDLETVLETFSDDGNHIINLSPPDPEPEPEEDTESSDDDEDSDGDEDSDDDATEVEEK